MREARRPGQPGKTLDEQIEGDHAYRDEPPQHPEPVIQTTYTVAPLYGQPGTGFTTTNPDAAEEASRNGHRVTAETRKVIA